MELIGIFSLLWARRLVMGLGLVVAVAAGLLALRVTSPGPGAPTWVASTGVLIDTADSQLVNVDPPGVDVLPTRAYLLADLMASNPLEAQVAREAGIPASQLEVLGPSSRAGPPVLTPLETETAKFADLAHGRYVLNLYADGESSLISIDAQAPDAARATTLAGAAISVLKSSLSPSQSSPAPSQSSPAAKSAAGRQATPAQSYVVTTLGPTRATQAIGPSGRRLVAAIGSLVVFALWCAGIVLFSGLARRMRLAQPA